MRWYQGTQNTENIGQSNRKLKSGLQSQHRVITMHARPMQTDS